VRSTVGWLNYGKSGVSRRFLGNNSKIGISIGWGKFTSKRGSIKESMRGSSIPSRRLISDARKDSSGFTTLKREIKSIMSKGCQWQHEVPEKNRKTLRMYLDQSQAFAALLVSFWIDLLNSSITIASASSWDVEIARNQKGESTQKFNIQYHVVNIKVCDWLFNVKASVHQSKVLERADNHNTCRWWIVKGIRNENTERTWHCSSARQKR